MGFVQAQARDLTVFYDLHKRSNTACLYLSNSIKKKIKRRTDGEGRGVSLLLFYPPNVLRLQLYVLVST